MRRDIIDQIKQWKRTKTFKLLVNKTAKICKDSQFQKERDELVRLFDFKLASSYSMIHIFCDKWNIDFNNFINDPYQNAYDGLKTDELPLKGITVSLPFDFHWQGPGCIEKFLTIKIKQPISHQFWEDLWQSVEHLQETTFGKPSKGRPVNKFSSHDKPGRKHNTLKDRIRRGKELYGSHVDLSWYSNLPIDKDISEKLSSMSKRCRKFLVYTMATSKTMKKSNRELARMFSVSKDTISNWILDVRKWSDSEKKAVESELKTSKNLPNKDVYDISRVYKTNYALTNEGVYNNGKKKIHRSSYKH